MVSFVFYTTTTTSSINKSDSFSLIQTDFNKIATQSCIRLHLFLTIAISWFSLLLNIHTHTHEYIVNIHIVHNFTNKQLKYNRLFISLFLIHTPSFTYILLPNTEQIQKERQLLKINQMEPSTLPPTTPLVFVCYIFIKLNMVIEILEP